jgi:hypothetical protein
MTLDPKDIRLDSFGHQHGGQRVGMDTGVRATHLPSGISTECNDDRSQHRNKEKALKELAELVNVWSESLVRKATLFEVLDYGWACGFDIKQTLDDCKDAGYEVPEGFVKRYWTGWDQQAEKDLQHSDDVAVDKFAAMMKVKLAKSREKGRGGWDDPEQCSVEFLAKLLVEHVAKGDPVDVANLAMMLTLREATSESLKNAFADEAMKMMEREGWSSGG